MSTISPPPTSGRAIGIDRHLVGAATTGTECHRDVALALVDGIAGGYQAAVVEHGDRTAEPAGQLQANQVVVVQLDLVKLVMAAVVEVDAAARGDLAGHRLVEFERRGLARIHARTDAVATAGDQGRGNGQCKYPQKQTPA
ncbi:hypothetical protein G6F68_015794 [Rhizopus microsporus]|nr:hypothetical protein G6F68_015794 [Rhizopus microsporus]